MQLLHSGIHIVAIVQVQHPTISKWNGVDSATNNRQNAPLSTGVLEMTYTAALFHPGTRLREWFEVRKKEAVERRAQRSVYFRTLHELERSSNRDLDDIGISRLSIKELAYEVAYGDRRSQSVSQRT
jgi:hypothetical protein